MGATDLSDGCAAEMLCRPAGWRDNLLETVREFDRVQVELFLAKPDEEFRAATVRERGLTLASTRNSPLPDGRGSKTRLNSRTVSIRWWFG